MPILYLALVLSLMASIAKRSDTSASVTHVANRLKRRWGGVALLLLFCLYFSGEFYAALRVPLRAVLTANASQESVLGPSVKSDIAWAESAVFFAPLNPLYRQSLIDICYTKGSYSKALKHSILSLRMNPLSEEALLSTGMIYNALNIKYKVDVVKIKIVGNE